MASPSPLDRRRQASIKHALPLANDTLISRVRPPPPPMLRPSRLALAGKNSDRRGTCQPRTRMMGWTWGHSGVAGCRGTDGG